MPRGAAPKRYTKAPVRQVAYRPEHDELFELAGPDWTRPRHVHVTIHKQGWTFEGQFLMPGAEKTVAALRTRVRKYADGTYAISEQRLALRFYLRGKLVKA